MCCLQFFHKILLEKIFGQARKRYGGTFYIDVNDVMVAGKVKCLRQLVKNDIIAKNDDKLISTCSYCKEELYESDVDFVESFLTTALEELLDISGVLKHKVVYIAGYCTQT